MPSKAHWLSVPGELLSEGGVTRSAEPPLLHIGDPIVAIRHCHMLLGDTLLSMAMSPTSTRLDASRVGATPAKLPMNFLIVIIRTFFVRIIWPLNY